VAKISGVHFIYTNYITEQLSFQFSQRNHKEICNHPHEITAKFGFFTAKSLQTLAFYRKITAKIWLFYCHNTAKLGFLAYRSTVPQNLIIFTAINMWP
jgi:hypothetical protein